MRGERLTMRGKACAETVGRSLHATAQLAATATRTLKPKPLHDWSSHGADALSTVTMGFGDHSAPTPPPAYELACSCMRNFGRSSRKSNVSRGAFLLHG